MIRGQGTVAPISLRRTLLMPPFSIEDSGRIRPRQTERLHVRAAGAEAQLATEGRGAGPRLGDAGARLLIETRSPIQGETVCREALGNWADSL